VGTKARRLRIADTQVTQPAILCVLLGRPTLYCDECESADLILANGGTADFAVSLNHRGTVLYCS